MRAPAVGGTERVADGHIMPVATTVAPTVGGTKTIAGRYIMPVAVMVVPTVGGTGGCKPGTERVGSAPLTSVNGLFRNPDFTQ